MSWSTREVAELAGTTLRTVRHYHDVGLLAEPERADNGYKRYRLRDLLRLLRIRRLVELGFTLTQIAEMSEDAHSTPDLDRLDAELADRIATLERTRRELDAIRRQDGRDPLLGAGLSPAAERSLTSADRDFLILLARITDPEVLRSYLAMVEATCEDPLLAELDALPADADEECREDLARRLAGHTHDVHEAHPALRDPVHGSRVTRAAASAALRTAIEELYNPAQVDVLRRIGLGGPT